MTQYALIFEAESIQSYIFDSGRLSDAVGASVRLDQLCGDLAPADAKDKNPPDDLLSRVIATVLGREIQKENDPDVAFSRRGGGAFIALFQSAALRDRVQAGTSRIPAQRQVHCHSS